MVRFDNTCLLAYMAVTFGTKKLNINYLLSTPLMAKLDTANCQATSHTVLGRGASWVHLTALQLSTKVLQLPNSQLRSYNPSASRLQMLKRKSSWLRQQRVQQ